MWTYSGLVVSVDRCERGKGEVRTCRDKWNCGLKTTAIVTMNEVVGIYITEINGKVIIDDQRFKGAIDSYYKITVWR